MEPKRPFAKVAARASAGCALGALALFVAPELRRLLPATTPEAYSQALFSLCALGVFVCLLVSLVMGLTALCGLRRHGRSGILTPALVGLVLSGLMMVPILRGLNAGLTAQAQAREIPKPSTPGRP